ncbi:AAA family ATPase [Neobacillus sp. LXY-4]|uniref:AAA family ATPase n=1 Tax=Neobacillus sp. LXY-4 TaxID=3379826 RepID=UPI003EE1CF6C
MNWYYYSDTNIPNIKLESLLVSKQYSLTIVNTVDEMHPHLMQHQQSVLFLQTNSKYNVYELCQEVSVLYPHVYIVLIIPDNMENMKRAMQVGASDLLRTFSDEEELKAVILQAEKYLKHRENKDNIYNINLSKNDCRVISVCNPKGGLGRTAFVVNAATSFAKQGLRVAVIDANLQFGDVALYFDLKPKRTIYEWVKEAYDQSNYTIDQYLIQHSSGVSVLSAPLRPEFFEFISADHMEKAIEELKNSFEIIIIDTPAYLSEIHLICLQNSDEIFVMMTNDVPILRTTKLYIDTMDSLNFKGKVKLIMNRVNKNKGLDGKRVEEILGMPIFALLPDQETVVKASLNEGIPFILSQPKSPISKAVIEFTEKFSGNNEEVKQSQKREIFGFLLKR